MDEKKHIECEAAFNALLKLIPKVDDDGYCWVIRGDAATAIDNIPAADVRPVARGRWKLATYSGKFGNAKEKWYDQFLDGAFWYCDQCRERARKSSYCPNCGADMRGES